jgi:hypothetical protein
VDENATYGFYRNLYALRGLGLTASLAGVVGCGALLLLPHDADQGIGRAIFGLLVSLMCGVLIARAATEDKVKERAFGYAVVLIRAVDGFE